MFREEMHSQVQAFDHGRQRSPVQLSRHEALGLEDATDLSDAASMMMVLQSLVSRDLGGWEGWPLFSRNQRERVWAQCGQPRNELLFSPRLWLWLGGPPRVGGRDRKPTLKA